MTTAQPLPPGLMQPVVNNKDTSSFKGKCAGMVSEINNCSDKDDGESFQPPQLAGMHSEIKSYFDEDDDDSFQPPLKYNIWERLALWATKFNITHITYGCERWVQKGEHFRSRIIFPETEASLRNDKQFADNFYQNHQTGTSPF